MKYSRPCMLIFEYDLCGHEYV